MPTKTKKEKGNFLFSMLCCGRRSSPKKPISVQTESCSMTDRSDYVVEKLAIKNLPLSSFATPEDFIRYNTLEPQKMSFHKHSFLTPTTSSNVAEAKETAVLMSLKNTSSPSTATRLPSYSSHQAVVNHENVVRPFHMQFAPKTVMVKDKEAQLVTNILNKHASLYTLDNKNPIPKDPKHQPRTTVVIPPSVQQLYGQDSVFPKKHSVHVHNQIVQSAYKHTIRPTSAKKDMSPEIKETINALRLAQKPHLPGVQPKNQKSIVPSVTPRLTETEISSRLLVETVSDNDDSFKIATELMNNQIMNNQIMHNKYGYPVKPPKIIEHHEREEVLTNIYLQRQSSPGSNKSSEPRILKNLIDVQEKNEKISSDEIGKGTDLKSSIESLEEYAEKSEKTSDATPIKPISQNLKWKIIIKHHSDKPKATSVQNNDTSAVRHFVRNSLNFPG